MTRILFVEDDDNLGMLLKENLDKKGFETIWCKDGIDGMKQFTQHHFDLCILDIMMPAKDGFAVLKDIRTTNRDIPVIFLTARSLYEDKIEAFEQGCDDYITKPFSSQELCLRINAILKRCKKEHNDVNIKTLTVGNYTIDYTNMTLHSSNEERKLSQKEADLILMLFLNKNNLVLRSAILTKVWGNDDYFSAKSMDVYMSKIRRYLKEDTTIKILNAYGIGYKLTHTSEEQTT